VIAPLDANGELFLVVQYRLAGNGAMLELPAGTLDVHDGIVEDPEVAAGASWKRRRAIGRAGWSGSPATTAPRAS